MLLEIVIYVIFKAILLCSFSLEDVFHFFYSNSAVLFPVFTNDA